MRQTPCIMATIKSFSFFSMILAFYTTHVYVRIRVAGVHSFYISHTAQYSYECKSMFYIYQYSKVVHDVAVSIYKINKTRFFTP